MILQSLYRYYEILSKDPETDIAPPGYSTSGVSFVLNITSQGELLDVFPLFELVQRGKKMVEKPRRMVVPEQAKRSGTNPVPNFLCDNPAFVLGISKNDERDPEYSMKRFNAFQKFNIDLLTKTDCATSRAVISFLNRYEPHRGREHPEISPYLDKLLEGGNLIFRYKGENVHDNNEIRRVWDEYRAGKDVILGQCLVTGEIAPIARLHHSIKGVRDAQSSGATLVGFNARAYESYNRNKGQGLNSPVSEKATFAYTTALNYLLSPSNPNKIFKLGDATVVYWAESEEKEYANAFASLFEPDIIEEQPSEHEQRRRTEERMRDTAEKVRRVQPLNVSRLTEGLDPNTRFYVLGLSPNAARISVRFFITEPFGKIVKRIMQHYHDLKIIKEFENQPEYIPLYMILAETVSKKARDQSSSPLLAGSVMRSILTGAPYPTALFYAIINRTRADMDESQSRVSKINYVRAAVVKAYLIRKFRNQPNNSYQEVLKMSLNEHSRIPAYVLGRLFAVLEKVQLEAVGSVNASIKDRYFTSACASPNSVFPVLLRLSQHHISKAEFGYASDRRIQDLLNLMDVEKNPFPSHLTLDQQGLFILGYYHQRAAFFTKTNNAIEESIKT